MTTIVTLTMNPALDVALQVEELIPEHKLRCQAPDRAPGGGGVNVSRVVRELGGRTLAIFPVGGASGDEHARLLMNSGVACDAVPVEARTRESVAVHEILTASMYRLTPRGGRLAPAEQERCLDAVQRTLKPGDVLVVSGSLPEGVEPRFMQLVIDHARSISARTVVDSSGEALSEAASARPTILKPNRRELASLLGREIGDDAGALRGATEALARNFAETVVVSLGSAGAILAGNGVCLRARGPEVESVSAIGAGDSMVAGLALALAQDQAAERVLAWGVAAGTAAVLTPGSRLLRRDDFERLLPQVTIREGTGA